MDIESRLATRAHHIRSSRIRELAPYITLPEMISFGGGYPDPDYCLFREFGIDFASGAVDRVAGIRAAEAFQYGPTAGNQRLLERLLAWHNDRFKVPLEKQHCIILNGSQEGLFILSFLFLESDDSVIMAEPAYPGAIMACSPFSREIIPVSLDNEGICVDDVSRILFNREKNGKKAPKFIYTVPSGHNPTGVTLSVERRRLLLALAEEYDTLIIEDDPYRFIELDEGNLTPETIQSLETHIKRVVRLDSFSKILSPGLRLGYATGHPEIIRRIVLLKQSINLQTGMLAQGFLDSFFETHSSDEINRLLTRNNRNYRNKRDQMIEMAQRLLPGYISYQIPNNGLFIWFSMPRGYDSERMIREDSERLKVLLVPGNAFAVHGDFRNYMRASFATAGHSSIEAGMRRFSEMIQIERERMRKDKGNE